MSRDIVEAAAREPVTPERFRAAVSGFASGLTVITSRLEGGEAAGFTCQSFHSLSLDPPLVAYFAGLGSTSFARIRREPAFCVNVLSAGQAGLARQFARSGADKFAGVPWRPDEAGCPVLEGCLAAISCRRLQEHPGGDHVITVGAVTGLHLSGEGEPLLFFRSRFAGLSDLP